MIIKIYGAIIIKGVFQDWIEPLRNGFQKVLDNPSQHGREMLEKMKEGFLKIIAIGKE